MRQYHELLQHVLDYGVDKSDRTGTGTRSIFGHQMRFDLGDSFPLVTTKKVFLRGVIAELLWFLSGSTNIRPLVQQGVSIWTDWPLKQYNAIGASIGREPISKEEFERQIRDDQSFANSYGNLGPIYSEQWRSWGGYGGEGIDQIFEVIEQIKENPDSRRLIVNAWNPLEVDNCALPPCHAMFQFYVANGKLSCQLYQRSADLFLGVPFNIASYALLTMMVAQVCGLEPGEFVWTGGDCHIYSNHFQQVREQLSRYSRPLPVMKINPGVKDIFSFQLSDFTLEGYDPHPAIKAPVAV